jgi:gluconolactonase
MELSTYSLNVGPAIARGEMDVFRFLATCRAQGLEGVSLHLRDLPGTRPADLSRVRRACLDHGLSLAMVTVSTDFGRAADRLDGEKTRAVEAVLAASLLGAPLLRVFAGSAPNPAGRAAAWDRAVASVRSVCEEAAKVCLPVGLQNHNHGGLCGTGADLLRFVKEVDHPGLTVVLDCGQFVGSRGASGAPAEGVRDEKLYESIRAVAPLARHVRVKFYRPRADGSEPFVDYGLVLDILRAVHYPGFLDIVYEPRPGGEPFDAVLPRIVGFLRSKIRDTPAGAGGSPTPAAASERYQGLDNGKFFADAELRSETDVAFLEGPAVDRSGLVYFTDVRSERIYTWDPGRRRLAVFRERSGAANGLLVDREGRLVACEGAGRVTRTDPATGKVEVLAERFEGRPIGAPNDLDVDSKGRIYFSSRLPNRDPNAGNVNAVYRIDPNGSLHRVLAAPEVDMPNGLAVAPGDAALYVIDADGHEGRARRIRAYDLRPDGTVTRERTLYDFAPGRSGDGLALDAERNLYVAAGLHRRRGSAETLDTRPGVHVISPRGELLAFLETPEDLVTNCAFGGQDRRTLYVTCGKKLMCVRTRESGKGVD